MRKRIIKAIEKTLQDKREIKEYGNSAVEIRAIIDAFLLNLCDAEMEWKVKQYFMQKELIY